MSPKATDKGMQRKFLGAVWLVLATAMMLGGMSLAYNAANTVAQSPPGGLHSLMVIGAVVLDVVILLIALFLVTRLPDLLM